MKYYVITEARKEDTAPPLVVGRESGKNLRVKVSVGCRLQFSILILLFEDEQGGLFDLFQREQWTIARTKSFNCK